MIILKEKIINIYHKLISLLCSFQNNLSTPTFNTIAEQIRNMRLGNNKLSSFIDRTIQSVTEDDLYNLTEIKQSAFRECNNLTNVTIPDSVKLIEALAFLSCQGLTNITIPDSVIKMEHAIFRGCSNLRKVTIGKGVTSIGSNLFDYCEKLQSVTLPFIGNRQDGTDKTYFGYLFGASNYEKQYQYVPTTLKEVIITSPCKTIEKYAFWQCKDLSSVTIPDSVTSIGHEAFYLCSKLTNVTIPNSVTSIGSEAFVGCTSLRNITIPDNITKIGTGTFLNCSNLTNIIIPDNVTTIDEYAFQNCTSLANIILPDSAISIGRYAFENTAYYNKTTNWENDVLYIGKHLIESKESISGDYVIKDGTLTIAKQAFSTRFISTLTIPSDIIMIAKDAFEGASVRNIYMYPTTPPILENTGAIPSNATIHVPIGSGDAYKAATNWANFANKIVEDIVI